MRKVIYNTYNEQSFIIKIGVIEMGKVQLMRENGVSMIQFNRPESYNALDLASINQLAEILGEVKANSDKLVILTGKGKAFSAGGDVSMMATFKDESLFDELMDSLNELVVSLYTMDKIVISAVNGSAAGLGLSIALNADYVVANHEAKFGMLFAGIGLIPDGGGHFFLKERVGTHQAKQFIWGLEQIKGEEAKEYGFVDVLTEGDALEAAQGLALQLQTSPLLSLIKSKEILHGQKLAELKSILQEEKKGQLIAASTEDHQEGVSAFLEKRRPKFQGK